jgi:hypothetical protein
MKKYTDDIYFKYEFEEINDWKALKKAINGLNDTFTFLEKLECKIIQPIDNGHLLFSIPVKSLKEYCKQAGITPEDLLDESGDI